MFTEAILAFGLLTSKAFAKIILMLLAVLITFLAIPQSRVASMLGVSILSAFGGGLLLQVYADSRAWTDAFALSVAFGSGFIVFPILVMFTNFYRLLNADEELHEAIYTKVRKIILAKVDDETGKLMPIETKKEITETKIPLDNLPK